MNIIVRHVKIGLIFMGAWPGLVPSKIIFVLLGMFVFSLIFQIWNAVTVINQLDLLMNNLGTTMPVTSVVLKLAVLRMKFVSVKYVVNEMIEDSKTQDENIKHTVMKKNRKIAIYLSNAIIACYNGLIISYLIIAVLSYNAESINDRQFIMQANFPINAKKSPIFEIFCILQFMVAFFGTNGHALIEGLLMISVLHANTKAFGVCQEISKFSNICQAQMNRKNILKAKQELIKKHLNFITFAECIQDIYAYISFFHLFLMTLINCIVGYMLINLSSLNEDNIFTFLLCIVYIFVALSAVASYCIAGEYLAYQSLVIFEELYNCPWYKFKPCDSKILIFMFMKSQQPLTISMGKFGNLSLVYFTKIIKTSVSYLSLIRAVSS